MIIYRICFLLPESGLKRTRIQICLLRNVESIPRFSSFRSNSDRCLGRSIAENKTASEDSNSLILDKNIHLETGHLPITILLIKKIFRSNQETKNLSINLPFLPFK